MSEYEKKEEKVLSKISEIVVKLDSELDKLTALDEDTNRKHEFKKWYAEKKALHDIKHILHEEGRYAKYDEDEMKKIDAYFEDFEG